MPAATILPAIAATAPGLRRGAAVLGSVAALAGLLGAAFASGLVAALVLAAAGAALSVAAVLLWTGRKRRLPALLTEICASDPRPALVTDPDGAVRLANAPARARLGEGCTLGLARGLDGLLAAPQAAVRRLSARAWQAGTAQERFAVPGGTLTLHAQRIGAHGLLWRVAEEPGAGGSGSAASGLPALTVDRDGRVLYVNEALRRLLGTRAETLDRVFTDLPLRSGETHHVTGPEGPVPVHVTETAGPGGRRDIFLTRTDGSGARLRGFFDELPVALLRVAPGGRVIMANRMARDLLCHSMNGDVRLSNLVQGLGRPVADWLAEAAEGRGLLKPEIVQASRAEGDVYLQIALNRIVEDGEVSLIAVLNDATELKTLEAQFVQSQKMQAIGQLAGGVAHDFNNLLTAISGHCDLLLLRHDKGDPDFGDLMQIAENANRAASLVGQLLAFSRKQTLRPEVLDLRDTLSDLAHLLNRLVGERVTLTLHRAIDLAPIRADKRQLEQVIVNLAVNARDAMPGGGEIRIDTRDISLAEPLRRDRAVVPAGEYVQIRVADEGTGIAPGALRKVFEPFYTTKRAQEGTGLGLSTAYGIVKQTGGFIFVDSTPGAGTVFTLYFPAHRAARTPPAPDPPASRPAPAAPPGEGVVLLVEDEAPVRAFASRALRMRGFSVIEAESGEEALERLADEALEIDIFVSDVVMPGLDGPSWVRRALQTRPDAKVVFMSGYAEDSLAAGPGAVPGAVFLPKPFSLGDLSATVQAQLANTGADH